MKTSSLLVLALPAALAIPALLVSACSSSNPSPENTPDSGSLLDSGGPGPVLDAGDTDTGTSPVLTGDGGDTDASPLDASSLTCPGPSFDGGASLGPGVFGIYTDCTVVGGGAVDTETLAGLVTLTVAEGDAGLTATYAYADGGGGTLDFAPTSATSATLAPPLQNVGAPVMYDCFGSNGNPGIPSARPATLTAASGALTYDEGSAFLSLVGVTSAPPAPGPLCGYSTGEATLAFVCNRGGDAGAPVNGTTDAGATVSVAFASGDYACNSHLALGTYNGASTGILTLSATGGSITTTYSGDPQLSGQLLFVATSDTTAVPIGDVKTLTAHTSSVPGTPSDEILGLTAASLSMDCGTLFLSFSGAVAADDTGGGPVATTGNLTCTRK